MSRVSERPRATASELHRIVTWLSRPGALIGIGVVLGIAAFQLWQTPENPPGFIRDEASIAYNAYSISQSLRDENGGRLPLYIRSFRDYKSPLFVYALAAVFRVTGPDKGVARGLAAASVLAAVLLLGLLALRRSSSATVALAVVVLAGTTPWLFELGRVALEVSMEPLVLVALLLALDGASRLGRWTVARGVPVGLALGALMYVYAAGRLLAPLLAVALIVFAGHGRLRWLATCWATFALTLVPLAFYWHGHPGALSARYHATTFVEEGMSSWEIVKRAVANYVHDVNIWHWLVDGDPKPYIHASDYPTLFAVVVLLAVVGAGIVLLRRRDDLWWRYILVATALAPVPAALTEDRFNAVRMVPVPVLLAVLSIPALAVLRDAVRERPYAVLAAVVIAGALTLGQFVHFLDRYRESGPGRIALFEAGVPGLLDRGFASGGRLHIDFDDLQAQAHALWRSAERGLPRSRVVILADGGVPLAGATVFGRFQPCDYECREFARWGDYWLARATVG
jgi:hypothetical protein